MENATHGLKIAFGVIVFVIALTISFMQFTKVKKTLDAIIYTKDDSSYYEIKDYENENPILKQKRIVGLETVIPCIMNYYNSKDNIYLRKGSYSERTGEVTGIQDIKVYTSNISEDKNYFNIEEEKSRREEWTESQEKTIKRLNAIIYGGTYNNVSYRGLVNSEFNNGVKFVEEISIKDIEGKKVTDIYYTII